MRAGLIALLVIIAAAAVVAFNGLFIVSPTQQALVLQFGEVRQAIRQPGLHTKIPFLQQVLYLDKRNLDLDVPAQEIIAADQKRLVVDAFMRYRIADPVRYRQSVPDVLSGPQRLSTFVTSAIRAVLADRTFTDIVRDDRAQIMLRISERVAANARDIGVEVVDVRLRRADLPEANSEAIYRRMETERQQEAREIRAQGQEAAQRVRAAADRTATVLRAEAQRESEQIRGEGDAQRTAIFADAYQLDPDFFNFYRAMQAYEQAFDTRDTRLVLSPDAEFFRYFNNPTGPGGPRGNSPLPAGAATGENPAPGIGALPAGEPVATPASATGSPEVTPAPAPAGGAAGQQTAAPPANVNSTDAAAVGTGVVEEEVQGGVSEEAVDRAASELAPQDASTVGAVTTAEPAPSPAANAAAEGVAGQANAVDAENAEVIIVRPAGEGAPRTE